MSARLIVLASLLTLWPGVAPAQPTQGPTENARLPWGDPDLQGIWFYQTQTPLERPEAFADRPYCRPKRRRRMSRNNTRSLRAIKPEVIGSS